MNSELEYLKTHIYYEQLIKLITYDGLYRLKDFNSTYNINFSFTFLKISLKYYSDRLINKIFLYEDVNGLYWGPTFLSIITHNFYHTSEFKQSVELYYKYGGKYDKNVTDIYSDSNMIFESLYFKAIYSRIFTRYWLKKIFRKIYQKRAIYMAVLLAKSNIKMSNFVIPEFLNFIKI